MTCGLDGGLWPLFWMTVAICATYLIARFWMSRYEKA